MRFSRRQVLYGPVGAFVLPTTLEIAQARAYPTHPVVMIVPYPAGGPVDAVGRVVAEAMRTSLGQPIIIENVSGADGNIGVGRAARATPKGYTILFSITSAMVLNAAFYSLPYDVLKDFAPISPLSRFAMILFARKTMPANDLKELIVWLKANPNKTSAAITTVGFRLLNVFFPNEKGVRYTLVPHRGSAQVMQDLLTGNIDLWFGSTDQLPLVRSGDIMAYAAVGVPFQRLFAGRAVLLLLDAGQSRGDQPGRSSTKRVRVCTQLARSDSLVPSDSAQGGFDAQRIVLAQRQTVGVR
jgi:tripartite-type tricarboxylate transporter receptor subunit TctC